MSTFYQHFPDYQNFVYWTPIILQIETHVVYWQRVPARRWRIREAGRVKSAQKRTTDPEYMLAYCWLLAIISNSSSAASISGPCKITPSRPRRVLRLLSAYTKKEMIPTLFKIVISHLLKDQSALLAIEYLKSGRLPEAYIQFSWRFIILAISFKCRSLPENM